MKRLIQISLLLLFCNSLWLVSKAQMNVQDNRTAQQLINKLVGANVLILNPVLNCDATANGTFDITGPSNLGLSGGVILATGATNTNGTNTGLNGGGWGGPIITGVSTPGDSDLSNLIGGDPTFSACTLEFDFIPDIDTTSTLSFKYVFGSEEYPNYTCSQFNDVFGFLITGAPSYTNTNIALVPGTNIPVTINSINSGVPSPGYNISTCNAMGPGSPFPMYFVNNTGSTVRLPGFTTVLEAKATVEPCSTYHMKLGIANVVDAGLQSAVFLLENSFSVDSIQVKLADIVKTDSGYIAEGCSDAKMIVVRDTTHSTTVKKLCFDYGGTATYGTDYNNLPYVLMIPPKQHETIIPIIPTVDNTPELPYETLIIRRLNCCTQTPVDSVELRIYDSLQIKLYNNDTGMCGGQVITLHASGYGPFTYEWTPANKVDNPHDSVTTALVNETTTFTVKASFLSCPDAYKTVTATVESTPIVNILTPDMYDFCVGDSLKIAVDIQPTTLSGESYTWAPNFGLNDPFIKEPYFYVTEPGAYKYILAVQTPQLGCIGTDSIYIDAKPAAHLIDVTPDTIVKYGDYLQLHAGGTLYYNWMPSRDLDYPTSPNPIAYGIEPTTFAVVGMNEYGCTDTAYVRMNIDFTMYENIPSAFSPNGDGKNDVFSVKNLRFQQLVEFRIYNRWGQEVFSTTDRNKGWDGKFKGVNQEIGVYQYIIRIVIPDGTQRVYKGPITLVR